MSSVRREPTLPTCVTALEQSHVVAGDAIWDAIRSKLDAYLEGLRQEEATEGEVVSAP